MSHQSAVDLLTENPKDVFQTVSTLLLQVCDNILNHPQEIKFRRLRLSNTNVADKLLPAIGAIECLFEIGFEEAEDSFVLPGSSPLEHVRQVRDKLASKIHAQSKINEQSKVPVQTYTPSAPIQGSSEHIQGSSNTQRQFLESISQLASRVLKFENQILQRKARACVPEGELWIAAQNRLRNEQLEKVSLADAEEQGLPDLFLVELLQWFKHTFFSWVDKPECQFCTSPTHFTGLSKDPYHLSEAPRTEVYCCSNGHVTPFFRYTDPAKLLETRKGRCGEWADCFTLICRSLGMDARIVFDETDHVWTEVWSVTRRRWLHCDSCEALCDAPLTYQAGWGKKLNYVIAYSRDDVQDVTWRYTQEPIQIVLARRNFCNESELQAKLLQVRASLQSSVSVSRKKFLESRLLGELIEMMRIPGQQRAVSQSETQGRQSGSEEWRLQRGETGQLKTCWVWKATLKELEAKIFTVMYSASLNCYKQGEEGQNIQGWARGVFQASNVTRKEERDWKKVYLARREGSSESGFVEWRFEIPDNSGLEISTVQLQLSAASFSSGVVKWFLNGDKSSLQNLPSDGSFSSDALQGSRSVALRAELLGGDGNVAWQHTQLVRQDLDDKSFPLQITFILRPRTI